MMTTDDAPGVESEQIGQMNAFIEKNYVVMPCNLVVLQRKNATDLR